MKTCFGIVLALAALTAVSLTSTVRATVIDPNCDNWEKDCNEPCHPECPPGGGDTPEPASLSMLALGGAALLLRGRRK